MLNRRSRGPLCWVMAFFTASYQHLLRTSTHQGTKAPSAWCGFPYHTRLSPSPTLLQLPSNWVLTELYNSSTPTRSPTWSLKLHVWSSSSGNNCHAVHRSLSSGASLCSGTVGPSPCSILSALIRSRHLFRLLAIGMSHFLPVHHLGMAFLGRIEDQNITIHEKKSGNLLKAPRIYLSLSLQFFLSNFFCEMFHLFVLLYFAVVSLFFFIFPFSLFYSLLIF